MLRKLPRCTKSKYGCDFFRESPQKSSVHSGLGVSIWIYPKVADLPLKATDGTKLDLNIGVSPGFGGLIQVQIYHPVPPQEMDGLSFLIALGSVEVL